MYATCLFCNSDLGRNQALEHFPVGRRLAYDAAKGRLWVICRRCERWNLSPLEERWEAIEQCERMYSGTRLRVSTDNIGLARLREGLELVRIGEPQRPEFAAWRYGDQFGRRRRRHLIYSTAGIAAVAGLVVAGPATGFIAGGSWGIWQAANALRDLYEARRVRVRLRLPGLDQPAIIRKRHLNDARLVSAPDVGTWQLHVAHERIEESRFRLESLRAMTSPAPGAGPRELTVLSGDDALRAAGQLLPKLNAAGARAPQVQSAVRLIEEVGDPAQLFAIQAVRGRPGPRSRRTQARGLLIGELPTEVRLALEMAAHEETERRALEGELALL
ncbi:MAG: hypothetical protein M3282_09220, partial [Gemmatimonadota bacterium]|nr:hypothetical protein [Gemmatimonadota bacterium]